MGLLIVLVPSLLLVSLVLLPWRAMFVLVIEVDCYIFLMFLFRLHRKYNLNAGDRQRMRPIRTSAEVPTLAAIFSNDAGYARASGASN